MPNIKLIREVWPVDINKKSGYQIVDRHSKSGYQKVGSSIKTEVTMATMTPPTSKMKQASSLYHNKPPCQISSCSEKKCGQQTSIKKYGQRPNRSSDCAQVENMSKKGNGNHWLHGYMVTMATMTPPTPKTK